MKLGNKFYAVVLKDGSIAAHHEGYLICDNRKDLRRELKMWKGIVNLKPDEYDIKTVMMKEVEG